MNLAAKPTPNPGWPTTRRLAPDECEITDENEPGLAVVLVIPRDLDLVARLTRHTMTVAHARKIVAQRARLERELQQIAAKDSGAKKLNKFGKT